MAVERDSSANILGQSEDYRKGLVLGFTMAEIMLILLFLLLLLLGRELRNLHEQIDNSIPSDSPEAIAGSSIFDQWVAAKEKGLVPPDLPLDEYIGRLIFKSESDQLDILAAQIRALTDQINSKEQEILKLSKVIEDLKDDPDYISTLESEVTELKKDLVDAENRIKSIEPLNDALKKANLSQQEGQQCLLACGATGRPACWGESIRNPDFIYDIAMYDDYFWVALKSESFSKNQTKWNELPEKSRISDPMFLSASEFRRRMEGLVEYGKANNNCVFSVRLFDIATSTKKMYKDLRQLVGNYAYETPIQDPYRWSEGEFPDKLIIE